MNKLLMILAAGTMLTTANVQPNKVQTYNAPIVQTMNQKTAKKDLINLKTDSLILNCFKDFDSSKDATYEYGGLKYSFNSSTNRFIAYAVDDPSKVETLLLTGKMHGLSSSYSRVDFSEYTNVKNIILFDSGDYLPSSLDGLQLDNLYLACNLNVSAAFTNFKAKNVHYVATYAPNTFNFTEKLLNGLKNLGASNYYFYNWNKPFFESYVASLASGGIQFTLRNECEYKEENFHIVENYSLLYEESGITYLRKNKGSSQPSYISPTSFNSEVYNVNSHLESIYLKGDINQDDFIDKKYEIVDARDTYVGKLDYFKAKTLIANSNNTTMYLNEVDDLYLTYESNRIYRVNTISSINCDITKVGKVHIPNSDKDKFTKVIEYFGDKVEYYDELPTLDFIISDDTGYKYKAKSTDIDIDYTLKNIQTLKSKGVTVDDSQYLDDIFEANNMTLKETTYRIWFDLADHGYIAAQYLKDASKLPEPFVIGYTFEGWYYDKAYTNKVNSTDTFTKDKTIYAKYVKDEEDVEVVETPTENEEHTFEVRTPKGIYSSSEMDAKRFISKLEYGLVFYDGKDVTKDASFATGYSQRNDNKSNYEFTLMASYKGQTKSIRLNVNIDNTLGNLAYMVDNSNNVYVGFNCQDYDNLDNIETSVSTFISSKLGFSNPNVDLPSSKYLETKTYVDSYSQGNLYILCSGVNLKYSSSTTTVDETNEKQGYTTLDNITITKNMDIYEALREISPYILRKDGKEVEKYLVEFKVTDKIITFTYKVGEEEVKSHVITYKIVDSDYSYIIGNGTYHEAVLLMNKTKDDLNFNDIYKEALKNSYHYINNLETDYKLDLSKESETEYKDTIQRGNGSYYESNMKVVIADSDKANTKGLEYSKIFDKENNEITYTPKTTGEKIKETVDTWVNDFKDKMENNKVFKISMITVSSILGIIILYGAFVLIRKLVKWLKRR